MSEAIAQAVFGFLGVLSTAASGIVIAVVAKHHQTSKRIQGQVENGHATNLRDDLDTLTATVDKLAGTVDTLTGTVDTVAADVRGMRRDIGRLDRRNIEDGIERRELRQHVDRLTERVNQHDE